MSSTINVFYELKVADGKAEELKSIVKNMVAYNQAGEPGTRVYNVYLSLDGSTLTYWESHEDNHAMQFHAERFASGEFVNQILERTTSARLCLYGSVSDELKAWSIDHGFEVEYAELIDGFDRTLSIASP